MDIRDVLFYFSCKYEGDYVKSVDAVLIVIMTARSIAMNLMFFIIFPPVQTTFCKKAQRKCYKRSLSKGLYLP